MAESKLVADYFSTFIRELDAAGRATLRRSLAFPPGSWPPAFPYVERHVVNTSTWQRQIAYLVAGLQASSRAAEANGNFGEATYRLQRATGSGSIENRFMAILDSDDSALAHHLRQMVTLMSSHGVAPDWARLRRDLSRWRHPDRLAQLEWARGYYQNQQPLDFETSDIGMIDEEESTT